MKMVHIEYIIEIDKSPASTGEINDDVSDSSANDPSYI